MLSEPQNPVKCRFSNPKTLSSTDSLVAKMMTISPEICGD
ncbi:hypothetical protein SPLC1_S520770 [Arthrospira platensis C1]|nr:hypothetical protein SPLC1_S520770 [Arthrospira platensis C1]